LIFEKVATLEELETHWSLDDALRMEALLDMRLDIADAEEAKIRAKNGNRS
jgi:hypothetical protein